MNAADLIAGIQRPDFNVISSWVPSGAHVLDLGQGDGSLLDKLRRERQVTGYGVELKGVTCKPASAKV